MSLKAPTPCCLLDRAGRHTTAKLDVPGNVTPIFMPSRVTELNPVEIMWQYLRANWLSNRVFETYDAIIEAASEARRKLIARPPQLNLLECAIGPTSDRRYDGWYEIRLSRTAAVAVAFG